MEQLPPCALPSCVPAPSSGDPKFGVDVHNVDSGSDRFAKVIIIGSGAAVQREDCSRRMLDFFDSWYVEMFFRPSIYHALQHSVHIADCGRQDIYTGSLDKLFRFNRRRKPLGQVRRGFVDFRASADVADLAFHQHIGIDCFERFHGLFGLADIFFER